MNQAGRIEKRVHLVEQLLNIERDLDALAKLSASAQASAALAMLAARRAVFASDRGRP
jgi:hypothetical protein